MKNFFKWFAIIALVATIGFGFSACDDGSTGDNGGGGGGGDVTGTWGSVDGDGIVLNSNSFTFSQYSDEYARGTYSIRGNNLTLTFNEFKGQFLIDNGFEELETKYFNSKTEKFLEKNSMENDYKERIKEIIGKKYSGSPNFA
jgi:hypothetical protein